jgi:PPIC-type PPIASE domain
MRCDRGGRCGALALAVFTILVSCEAACHAQVASTRLATVNGHPVLQRDVDLELLLSGSRQPTPTDRVAALERAIDRTLVARFVASKVADPLAEDVENLVQSIRQGIESGGDTVESVLVKLKLTEADVRQAAQLSVSWEAYLGRTIKEQELRDYFESHREQFDGTKIRIRQIVRTIPAAAPPAEWDEAQKLLTDLQQQIKDGKIEFAAAAAAHSTGPSGKSGGDVGLIGYQGGVPAPVAIAAFALKVGEVSSPIRSSVGVHLVTTTERIAGELSLEDARPAVRSVLGEQLWEKTVKMLRAKARIVRQ